MKTNTSRHYSPTESSTAIVVVTRKLVRERAVALAIIIGRSTHDVSKSEWEQAKRELMGKPGKALKVARRLSVAESGAKFSSS